MSPGFCSFFVITVLIIQLVTLFHAPNVAFTANGHQTITSFKTQRYNLKTELAQLFQIAIHFHPGRLQLKTLTDSLDTLI